MSKFAISSPTKGTFLGTCLGLLFFTRIDCAGQSQAAVFDTFEKAQAARDALSDEVADLTITPVRSGHWRDLREAGLHIGEMMENDLAKMEPAGVC